MSIENKAIKHVCAAWIDCARYGDDMSAALHGYADSLAIYHADNLDVWSECGDHGDLDLSDCETIGAALARNACLHWIDALHAAAADLPDPDLDELTLDEWADLPDEIRNDSDMIARYLPIALATAARECIEGARAAGVVYDPEGEIPKGDWDCMRAAAWTVAQDEADMPRGRDICDVWREAARDALADRDEE